MTAKKRKTVSIKVYEQTVQALKRQQHTVWEKSGKEPPYADLIEGLQTAAEGGRETDSEGVRPIAPPTSACNFVLDSESHRRWHELLSYILHTGDREAVKAITENLIAFGKLSRLSLESHGGKTDEVVTKPDLPSSGHGRAQKEHSETAGHTKSRREKGA